MRQPRPGDLFLLAYNGSETNPWAVDRLIPHETGTDEFEPDTAMLDLIDKAYRYKSVPNDFFCTVSWVATENGDVWQATRITASKKGQGATPTDAVQQIIEAE